MNLRAEVFYLYDCNTTSLFLAKRSVKGLSYLWGQMHDSEKESEKMAYHILKDNGPRPVSFDPGDGWNLQEVAGN